VGLVVADRANEIQRDIHRRFVGGRTDLAYFDGILDHLHHAGVRLENRFDLDVGLDSKDRNNPTVEIFDVGRAEKGTRNLEFAPGFVAQNNLAGGFRDKFGGELAAGVAGPDAHLGLRRLRQKGGERPCNHAVLHVVPPFVSGYP